MCPAPSSETSRPAPRGSREMWMMAGLLALVLLGLAGLAAATGWDAVNTQLSRLGILQITLLLILSLVNYGCRAWRWHLFTNALGVPSPLHRNLLHFLAGLAMSVTPGRVGELVRMRWLRRETGWPVERTAPLALVDRASDLGSMALILAGAAYLATTGTILAWPVALAALLLAFTITRPTLAVRLVTVIHRMIGKAPRVFARLRRAAASLSAFSTLPVSAATLGLGMIGWVAESYGLYLLLGWMGAEVSLPAAIFVFTFATLAGGLTGAPGGLGGAEAAMVALLSLQGVPLEVSVPATAVIRLTTLWFAILIGLLLFPFAERGRAGASR